MRGGIDLDRGEEEYRGSNDYGDDVEWGAEPDHNDVWDSDGDDDGEDNYIHHDSNDSSDSDSEDIDMTDDDVNNNNESIGL